MHRCGSEKKLEEVTTIRGIQGISWVRAKWRKMVMVTHGPDLMQTRILTNESFVSKKNLARSVPRGTLLLTAILPQSTIETTIGSAGRVELKGYERSRMPFTARSIPLMFGSCGPMLLQMPSFDTLEATMSGLYTKSAA
jgi:hypothetical protein